MKQRSILVRRRADLCLVEFDNRARYYLFASKSKDFGVDAQLQWQYLPTGIAWPDPIESSASSYKT